jgi:CubicO group peptidase (beta-lactamase class C family)
LRLSSCSSRRGRVDLDAGIGASPDLKDADAYARGCCSTSGLHEFNDQPQVLADPHRHWTPDRLIAVAGAGRSRRARCGFHYSNTNYIALGELIERSPAARGTKEVHASSSLSA